jgi:Kef-type K+ transport system membrane component KefB
METHTLLLQIAIVLLSARLFAELAVYFRIPTIIGEIVAGIIIGPSLLGWVEPSDAFRLLAEIGIILLLFEVGLETDITRLTKAGPKAIVVAITGFIIPFILGSTSAYYLFDLSVIVSLFIGGTLTATSIGITVRILSDLGRHQSKEGQIVLGAAVIDDLLGVFLLAVLYEFAVSGSIDVTNVTKVFLLVGSFFFLAPVVAKLLSPIMQRYHDYSEVPGMIPVILVSLVLLFAGIAHIFGAPLLLGGFAAGIALSRRFFLPFAATLRVDKDFRDRITHEMTPIIRLFTPIFFVMVGLSLDLGAVDWSSPWIWAFSIGMAIIAIIAKLIGPFLICESVPMSLAVGMAMVPRGEVGLIFAELGRTSGLFNAAEYAGMILVITYTTLAAPFWIKLFYNYYGHRLPIGND